MSVSTYFRFPRAGIALALLTRVFSVEAGGTPDPALMAQGFKTFDSVCLACHTAGGKQPDRVAPPMIAVKKHYLRSGRSYSAFRATFTDFLLSPDPDKSQMPGAIRRFGLMPALGLDAETADAVAYYVYHTPMEQPDWFAAHYEEEHGKYDDKAASADLTDQDYLSWGRDIALQTKSVLGSQLKQALSRGGPVAAVSFCNENVTGIMTERSEALAAKIRRVTDQPRNPANRANDDQLQYIAGVKRVLAAGGTPVPTMQDIDGEKVGYYPITTNGMCLQCHGDPGREISEDTLAELRELYPTDEATGYGVNQLRGIWVVTLPSEGESHD